MFVKFNKKGTATPDQLINRWTTHIWHECSLDFMRVSSQRHDLRDVVQPPGQPRPVHNTCAVLIISVSAPTCLVCVPLAIERATRLKVKI